MLGQVKFPASPLRFQVIDELAEKLGRYWDFLDGE